MADYIVRACSRLPVIARWLDAGGRLSLIDESTVQLERLLADKQLDPPPGVDIVSLMPGLGEEQDNWDFRDKKEDVFIRHERLTVQVSIPGLVLVQASQPSIMSWIYCALRSATC